MWNIYGKQYDLTNFIDKHPGGRYVLEKTEGLDDCTALFETYHAFSDIEKIQQTLDKYEIKDQDTSVYTPNFTQYRELTSLVKKEYPDRNSVKANANWMLNNGFLIMILVFSFYGCYLSSWLFLYKVLCQIVYSCGESCVSFNVMHDASHYGISIHPTVNVVASKVMNNILLWNSNIWFLHHVYHHHSNTGLENDPDHTMYDYRLSKSITNYIPKIHIIHLLYQVIPGQQIGQGILYLLINITGGIGEKGMHVPNNTHYDEIDIVMCLSKIYLMYHAGLVQFLLHIFIANTLYYANIYPNHSSYETKIENHYEGNDWAKMQICNSGNFVMDNLWWTRAFGSINYQIEHHLFPNMSSIHYPAVSKIVRKYCKEHNIPYVNKATLYDAYKSFAKYVNHGE